jgi:hypothetical protein
MANVSSYIGRVFGATGTAQSERQLQNGSMATSNYSGRYYEASRDGKLFHCDFGVSATGIAINAIGTAAGVALYNPVGTGYNLSIQSVRLGMVSSTLILGAVMHGVNTNLSAAATTGTAGTSVPGLAGGGASAVGKPLYTATLPANPTPTRVFAYKQPTIATGSSFVLEDLLDGSISLAPGATWSLYVIGGDTSPLWKVSVTWIEEQVS